MSDRADRKSPSRASYALHVGEHVYCTGSYRQVVSAFDAINAFIHIAESQGITGFDAVPVIVEVLF